MPQTGVEGKVSMSVEARPTASMADAIAEGLVQCDERGRIEYLNPAAERLFGYPREELLGRDIGLPARGVAGPGHRGAHALPRPRVPPG
ncbi:MAG: PAS domain-containing protein [Gammaproteobacteria bacterium]|nr:PAS domain-containing protein [Gammaproteobacteria bacterium]